MKNNKIIKFVLKHVVAISACVLVFVFSIGYWVLSAVPTATSVGDNLIVAGNVGIGTTGPSAALHILKDPMATSPWANIIVEPTSNDKDSGISLKTTYTDTDRNWGIYAGSGSAPNNANFRIVDITAAMDRLNIDLNGNVGIGTTAPAYQLQLSLNSAAKPTSSSWTIASDERLKKNIKTLEGALGKMLALRGVTYEWIEPEKQGNMTGVYMGLIAQEVEKVFPEWITTDSEGYKNLTVTGFEALTAESFKELKAENDALRARIEALEARLNIGQ
jgi:hypothetical protein